MCVTLPMRRSQPSFCLLSRSALSFISATNDVFFFGCFPLAQTLIVPLMQVYSGNNVSLTDCTITYINVVLPVFVDVCSHKVGENTAAWAKKKIYINNNNKITETKHHWFWINKSYDKKMWIYCKYINYQLPSTKLSKMYLAKRSPI